MIDNYDPFWNGLKKLVVSLQSINNPANLEGLLAAYFLLYSREEGEPDWNVYIEPYNYINRHDGRFDYSPIIAVLGCLLYEDLLRNNHGASDSAQTYYSSLERLKLRKDIYQSSDSWIHQPNIVLGIALGIKITHQDDATKWMQDLLREGISRSDTTIYQKLTYIHAYSIIAGKRSSTDEKISYNISTLSIYELCYAIWLVNQQVLTLSDDKTKWLDQANSDVLYRIASGLIEPCIQEETYKNAIILSVARSYLRSRSHYPTTEMALQILRRFEPGLERWQSKWPIDDEYDVQALLWFLLRPYFDDLKYEENLAKLGRSGQRYDFGIPSIGTLIEAKYIRKKGDFQKIINEIGIDSSQLLSQTEFREMIVFVYDNTASAENHNWTINALKKITFVHDAIIASAPSVTRESSVARNKTTRTKM
jgi:hypothetical protein